MNKPVKAIPVLLRGRRYFRVIIPRSLAGGKRKTKWFRTKSKAEEYAAACETTRDQVSFGYEILPLEDRIRVGRCLQKAGSLTDLERAVESYIAVRPNFATTVGQLATECLGAKKQAGLAKSYLGAFQNTLRRFNETFDRREAHSVTAPEIESWLHQGKWQPETQKGYLKDVRTLYSYAIERGYAKENPALAVAMPKSSKVVPGILTIEEVERLMRTIESQFPEYISYIALTLFGGLRAEEAFRCRWSHVKADVVDLPAGKTKNNRRRLVEFAALEVNGVSTVQKWLAKKGDLPPKWRKPRMKMIREAAAPLNWSDNCLRHSFVSYAVPIFGISQTGLLADHSEAILKRHYRALVTRAEAEKFWGILPK